MSFHLKTLPFGTTLSRQIARQHLTRFNNVYWVAERSFKHTRAAFPDIHFPASAPGVHGLFGSQAEWEKAAEEHRLWVRQHIIVSAAALLEVYVKAAAVTAITAKPELIDKSYLGVDGFKYVKSDVAPKSLRDLTDAVTGGFVFGPWADRFKRIARVFGVIPKPLLELAPILQSIQTKRNKIAHQFGNDGKARRAPWDAFAIIEIGPKEIQVGITAVSDAISIFDKEIFSSSIGGHEVLLQFHLWKEKQSDYQKFYVSGRLAMEFRSYLGNKYGSSLSTEYIKGMIAYYNSI